MNKYIADHSLLTNFGALLFFGCIIVTTVYSLIVDIDSNIGFCSFIIVLLGGVLMMIGLACEM